MARKTKNREGKPDYLGVRIYVKDARTSRIARIKNAINHRDTVDLNVRDTNDRVVEAGCKALELELNLQQ